MTEGLRYNEGKLPLRLISIPAMEALAEVLQKGAEKYTVKFKSKLEGLWRVGNVKSLTLSTVKGCVVTVTKGISGIQIQILQKPSDKTEESGEKGILKECKNWLDVEEILLGIEKETELRKGDAGSGSWELQKNFFKKITKKDVQYVVPTNSFMWLMTTLQGNTEEYFVVSTTTVSDFWEMTLQGLKEHCNISKTATLLELTGERNWEKGLKWDEVCDSLMRHLNKWRMGEAVDPETGLSHIAHVLCNAMFLTHFERTGTGTDDRPLSAASGKKNFPAYKRHATYEEAILDMLRP